MKKHFLSATEMKKEMRGYNLALIFNRKKARDLRIQAAKKIYYFSEYKLHIRPKDQASMAAYIKTFGFIKSHIVSAEAYKALSRLDCEFYASEHNNIFAKLNIGLYNKARRFTRRIASLFGRYDAISRKIKKQKRQTFLSEDEKKMLLKNPKKYHKWKIKQQQKAQAERARRNHLLKTENTPYAATPTKGSWLKRQHHKIIGGIFALGAILGGAKFFPSSEKDSQSQPTSIEKTTSAASVSSDTIKTSITQETFFDTTSTTTSTDTLLSNRLKEYYNSCLNIHLGDNGRKKLLQDLQTAQNSGRITVPANESIEHLALVMTVSKLVLPNVASTKLLNKIQSEEKISPSEHNKIWHIVAQAGDMAQHIKGSGNQSNFDKQPLDIQKRHVTAINNVRMLKAAQNMH